MRKLFLFGALIVSGCVSKPLAIEGSDGGVIVDAGDDLAPMVDASSQDAASGGNPGSTLPLFDDLVTAIVHAGSSLYVGGQFTRLGSYPAPGILGLDLSGTPTTCPLGTGFDGTVEAVVQSGSWLYVGGLFDHYRGASANGIAKIDATTCDLDTTFSPPANNGFDGFVLTLAVSGSSLYVGGNFSSYRGIAGSANDLAKLDLASGAIDTTFSPPGATSNGFGGLNTGTVMALTVSGSSLFVGGVFTAYKGVANSANHLAKLDLTSGAIDTTFSPPGATSNGFETTVAALAVAGSSLYVGGFFTAYKGVVHSANGLAKLDLTSGAIDSAFSPVDIPNGATRNGFLPASVYSLAVAGSSLFVGGDFGTYHLGGTSPASSFAKLDLTSGAIDTSFSTAGGNNGFNGRVQTLAVGGGYLYAGGQFTAYEGVPHSAEHLARLDVMTGALDATFLPAGSTANGFGGNTRVLALSVTDSTVWAGGDFRVYGGYPANRIVKLDDATLAIDTTFSPPDANGFDSPVNALATDGSSLFVGGLFHAYRGVASSANGVAKLDLASGAIDTTFSPPGMSSNGFSLGAQVRALAVAGGSLYVGGQFSAYRGVASAANDLAKLDATSGALDTTFSPPGATSNGFEASADVDALAVAGSSVYVGGSFTSYRGVASAANHLAKLDIASGAIDATFSPPGVTSNGFDTSNPNGRVYALAVAGGSLYVGGEFTAYRGIANSANALAKLDLASGAIDTTFSPPGANNNGFVPGPYTAVLVLTVAGTSLYVGGWDTTDYRGVAQSANALAKLDLVSGDIDTTFSPPGATSNGFPGTDSVWALGVAGGSLLIGGDLRFYRGAGPLDELARVDLTAGAMQ